MDDRTIKPCCQESIAAAFRLIDERWDRDRALAAQYATQPAPRVGGPPSKGTPKDKRLSRNQRKKGGKK
jgi:hypothetical protein